MTGRVDTHTCSESARYHARSPELADGDEAGPSLVPAQPRETTGGTWFRVLSPPVVRVLPGPVPMRVAEPRDFTR